MKGRYYLLAVQAQQGVVDCWVDELMQTLSHHSTVHVRHLAVRRAEVHDEGGDEQVDAVSGSDQVGLKRRVGVTEPSSEVVEASLLCLELAHDACLLVGVERQEVMRYAVFLELAQVQLLGVVKHEREAGTSNLPRREMASSVASWARTVVHLVELYSAVCTEVRAVHEFSPANEALWVMAPEQVVHARLAGEHHALDLPMLQLQRLLHLSNECAHVKRLLAIEVMERVTQQLQLLTELFSNVDEVAEVLIAEIDIGHVGKAYSR